MKHTVGLMRENNLPSQGYELYFDERPGMVRIRFFENLGPAESREGEEQDDSIRFRYYDTWEYEIEEVEAYVMDNLAWLLERAKEEERVSRLRNIAEQAQKQLDATDYVEIQLIRTERLYGKDSTEYQELLASRLDILEQREVWVQEVRDGR